MTSDATIVSVDEADAAWEAFNAIRRERLVDAKTQAVVWLDRGDPAGCLVKFVELTRKPVLDGGQAVIDWTAPAMVNLIALGKLYLAPIAATVDREPFERLVAMSEARENMRRWVEGFR